MAITRREFLQMLAIASAYGLPLNQRAGAAARADSIYDLRKSDSNVTLLHFTDCHAQLLPTYFRGGTAASMVEVRYRFAVEAEFFEPMRTLEREFPDVSVGSYPQTETRELIIRLRGDNHERVAAAAAMLREIRPAAE